MKKLESLRRVTDVPRQGVLGALGGLARKIRLPVGPCPNGVLYPSIGGVVTLGTERNNSREGAKIAKEDRELRRHRGNGQCHP